MLEEEEENFIVVWEEKRRKLSKGEKIEEMRGCGVQVKRESGREREMNVL